MIFKKVKHILQILGICKTRIHITHERMNENITVAPIAKDAISIGQIPKELIVKIIDITERSQKTENNKQRSIPIIKVE